MEIDYIADSLMVLAAIGGCMMICSAVCGIIEMIFPGLGKLLDKLMGLYDDDV